MLKKMQITDRMNGIQAEIETLTRLSAEEEAYKSKVASAVELLEGEMQHEKITKELVNATIDTVYVYDKKRIEVSLCGNPAASWLRISSCKQTPAPMAGYSHAANCCLQG